MIGLPIFGSFNNGHHFMAENNIPNSKSPQILLFKDNVFRGITDEIAISGFFYIDLNFILKFKDVFKIILYIFSVFFYQMKFPARQPSYS